VALGARRAAKAVLPVVALMGAASPVEADAARVEVGRVTASPPRPVAGGPLMVSVRVRNAGRGRAARTPIRLRLQPLRKKRRGRALFASLRAPKLKPGKRARLRGIAVIPLKVRGRFRLVACPGRGKRGCGRARRKITVRRPRPRPLKVSPLLDRAAAKFALIGPKGGSVSAVAADGTKLELTIPPKALIAQQRITLTPLLRIKGLPFKLRGGAQLGPAGLRLLRPAKLTIDPPRATRVRRTATIGYAHGQAGLVPGKRRVGSTVIELMHFSGGALVDWRPAQWIRIGPRLPSSAEARAAQRLATALDMPGNAAAERAYVDALREWFADYVEPRLKLAVDEENLLEDAIGEAGAWSRYVQLRGLGDEFAGELDEVGELLRVAIVKSFKRSERRCADHRDVFFNARRLLILPRTAAVLGIDASLDLGEYDRCLRFDLDVESTVALRNRVYASARLDTRTEFRMLVPIRVVFAGPDLGVPYGNMTAFRRFSEVITASRGQSCHYADTTFRGLGGFNVGPEHAGTGFELPLGLGLGNQLLDGRLQVQGVPITAVHTTTCSTSAGSGSGPDSQNIFAWQGLYSEEHDVNDHAIVRDWRVFDGGSLYASKNLSRTVPLKYFGGTFAVATESTRFELHHVPE
jgi:hypothetical protein